MKKKLIVAMILALVLLGVVVIQNNHPKENKQPDGLVYYPPNLGLYESYNEGAKTYESKLGFSFKYPSHLYVMDFIGSFTSGPIMILPNSTKDGDDKYGVVVSVGLNDENMTPLEWLESPDSGADLSKGYNEFDLDGQEAIALDGGMWVVVNTPDNQYRLSIATLPDKTSEDLLFTEMGMVVDSLRFVK